MKKIIQFIASSSLLVTVFLGSASVALAVSDNSSTSNIVEVTPQISKNTNLDTLVSTALNIVGVIAGIIAVFYLIYAGFQYLTAGGDPKKAEAARSSILNAIIGIVIIIAAYLILNFAVGLGDRVTSSSVDATVRR